MSLSKRAPSWGEKWTFCCCCFGFFCLFVFRLLSFSFFSCQSTFSRSRADSANAILKPLFSNSWRRFLECLLRNNRSYVEGEALKSPHSVRHILATGKSPLSSFLLSCCLWPSRCSWASWSVVVWNENPPHIVCMHGVVFYMVITACWTLWSPCFYLSSGTGLDTGFWTPGGLSQVAYRVPQGQGYVEDNKWV